MASTSVRRAASFLARAARRRSAAGGRHAASVLAFERLDARSMLAGVVGAVEPKPGPPYEVIDASQMSLVITFSTPNVVAGQHVGYRSHAPGDATRSYWMTYGLNPNTLSVEQKEFQYLETSQFLVTSPSANNRYDFTVSASQNVNKSVWTGFVILGANTKDKPQFKPWGASVNRLVTAEDPGQYTIVPCSMKDGRLVADATQSYSLFLSVREGAQMHNARLLEQANDLLASIVQQERDAGYPLNDNPRIEAQKAVVEAIESADPYVLTQNITLEDCKGATALEADANFAKVAGKQSDSHLNRPQYFADVDNENKLSFKGTLCNVDAATGVNLFLGRQTTLYVPLTNGMSTYSGTMYTKNQDGTFQYGGKTWTYKEALKQVLENLKTERPTTWKYASQQTQDLIKQIDHGGGVCFYGTSGAIAYKSLSWSYEINSRVDIGGYGRIDGGRFADQSRFVESSGTAVPWTYYKLSEVLDNLEFWVGSGLLDVASGWNLNNKAPGNFAIDVWGLTVSQGAARGKGSVDLNTPWNSFSTGKGEPQPQAALNNAPVNVLDLKVVGNWLDAADGPEVMGEHSRLTGVYIHAADDSIKAAVSDLAMKEITVLQGNVGGVVDFGSYGYSRVDTVTGTVHDMSLRDIRVHRVTQTTGGYDESKGENGKGTYSTAGNPLQLNGLFTTRNSAFNPTTNGGYGGSIENVVLNGFGVADLGGDYARSSGLKGPNTFYRAYALGFIPNSYFGSTAEAKHIATAFSNWSFQFPEYVKNNLQAWGLVVATKHNSLNMNTNTDPSNFYNFGMQSKTQGKKFGSFTNVSWVDSNTL
jgi:hypothetical protein